MTSPVLRPISPVTTLQSVSAPKITAERGSRSATTPAIGEANA
jgi:hypothetical protein